MKQPDEEKGFQVDENGLATDPEEMRWAIHELSIMLIKISKDPRVQMAFGPFAASEIFMTGVAAHSISCDEHLKDKERAGEKDLGNLPKFTLGTDLNKLLNNL